MSKAFERSMKDAIQTGRAEGERDGEQKALVTSIKNIMDSLQCTVERAMEIVKIPQDKRPMYAGLIQNS